MTLTVPKAGIYAGRAAQVRYEEPETAAAVAKFGNAIAEIGGRMEADRLDRELQRSRVDMMEGLNGLRLEFEQIGDPDVIDRDFPKRADALRDQIFQTIDPKNRDNAALMFDEMRTSHAFALGARAIDQRQSQRMATMMRTADTVVRTGALADPQTQSAYLAQFDEHLSNMVATGVLSPEEAEARRMQVAGDMEAARATRLLSDDPQALIAAVDAGEFTGLDADRVQRYRASAVSAQRSAEAAAMSEAERARKEQLSAARDRLKDGIGVFRTGRLWAGDEEAATLLADPEIAALPEAREYAHARLLFEQKPEFARLPLAEKRRLLSEAEAQAVDKPYEADLVTAMRAQIKADEEGFAKDPFARAAEIGLSTAPDLPDPANATPDEIAEGLRARGHYAVSLRDAGYTDTVTLFSPAEREAWAPLIARDQNPADRARIAASLSVALGGLAEDAAAELGADPVFAYAGGLLANGGTETLARHIFEGQRVIDNKEVSLPPVTERRETYFGELSLIFDDGTGAGGRDEAAARNQVLAAADALYAYRSRGNPERVDGKISETDYLQAVHEVLGGVGKYSDGAARGGVQKVKGAMTLLPAEVSGDQVEGVMSAIDGALSGGWSDNLQRVKWAEISVTGNTPVAGGEPITRATWRSLRLRAVGDGDYELIAQNPGTGDWEAVTGDDGSPFWLSLPKAMSVYGARR